jgi:hypothetical protein
MPIMGTKMILKYRSVSITEEDFNRDLPKAVPWQNLGLEHYIACHNFLSSIKDPQECARGFIAHDAIVRKITGDIAEIFNPGRRELVVGSPNTPNNLYGADWYLVKPSDYTGPKE